MRVGILASCDWLKFITSYFCSHNPVPLATSAFAALLNFVLNLFLCHLATQPFVAYAMHQVLTAFVLYSVLSQFASPAEVVQDVRK